MNKAAKRSIAAEGVAASETTVAPGPPETATEMREMSAKQGQYLAFIYYYSKIHGRAPAETDIREYFKVSPPSVHQMLLTLERLGFISRIPGQARSVSLLVTRGQLPDLD